MHPRVIIPTPQDVAVMTEAPCIKFYDYSHLLIREINILGCNQLIDPLFFCIDRSFNILMTDCSAARVLIFSDRGQLLHKFGKRGEGRGDLISPTGIAVDREDRIIVVSCDPKHCIQIF